MGAGYIDVPTIKRQVTAVGASPTVIISPFSTEKLLAFALELINDDGSQILSATIQVSADAAGPWMDSPLDAFSLIDPGKARYEVINVSGWAYCQVVAVASGAGLNSRVTLIGERRYDR